MSKKPIYNMLGEVGITSAGFGIILPFIPFLPFDPTGISAGCVVFGIISGVLWAKKKSKFDILWRNLGLGWNDIYPLLKKKKREKDWTYTLYEFTIPIGGCIEDVERRRSAIQTFCGRGDIEFDYGYKSFFLKVYDQPPAEITYKPEDHESSKGIFIPFGYTMDMKMKWIDITKQINAVIAGIPGSGKSTLLRIIAVFCTLFRRDVLDLYLVDLKGNEFPRFKNLMNVARFVKTPEDTHDMVDDLNKEIRRRYDLFEKYDAVDLEEYIKLSGDKLKYKLLIIDEASLLLKETQPLLEKYFALGRACGISCFISTQKPDAKVLSTRITHMSSIQCCLSVDTWRDSETVLGHKGAENLKKGGWAILRCDTDETVIRVPWLSGDRAKQLIKEFNIDKTPHPAAAEAEPEPEPEQMDYIFDNLIR